MFSACANPDCNVPYRWGEGEFFRFHKEHAAGESAPNTHSVQHFWLCGRCRRKYMLEYRQGTGVMIRIRLNITSEDESLRFIAAA